MIQWVSAIEESKVDADIAYWNIDGNLTDSAVQANRGNGQWWLLNAYGQMSGHTVKVTPPLPDRATPCRASPRSTRRRGRPGLIFGGADGQRSLAFDERRPRASSGRPCTPRAGRSPGPGSSATPPSPRSLAEADLPVVDGTVDVGFGAARCRS